METKYIIMLAYFVVFGIGGGYYMAVDDPRSKDENITLFHWIGNIPYGLFISPFALFLWLGLSVIIVRRRATRPPESSDSPEPPETSCHKSPSGKNG